MLSIQERERKVVGLLARHGYDSLEKARILEIGCGTGLWLQEFIRWGARPENIVGIDLLPERIAVAKQRCPAAVTLECRNAATLSYPNAAFDLVLQSTVFTSILDPAMRQCIAAEMLRVLKPNGFVLWYDFHVNNPRNPDVCGVRKNEIRKLFPGCQIHLRRITLAPPIGRIVGRYSPLLYQLLSRTKILCTHYLGLIQKN
jgi:ubiquinone/menaquinone biosynthesis C-methylase UbiE